MLSRSSIGKLYGWRPQLPDIRDQKWTASNPVYENQSIDYRSMLPPVYDQGDTGSCTAQAGAATIQYEMKKLNLSDWTPSRLFIYYNERKLDGDVNKDDGSTIRTLMKSLNINGFCPETVWPFDTTKILTCPPSSAYSSATGNLVTKYEAINQTINSIRSVLQSGVLITFGISVYDSFESDAVAYSGMVPMPNVRTEKLLGGHAVLMVGDDPPSNSIIVRNSWGPNWGMNGYFMLPYQYVLNEDLCDDFWGVQLITEGKN